MLKKELCRSGLNSSGSRRDTVAGLCKNANKTYGSIRGRKYLQWLTDYQLLCCAQLGSLSDALIWSLLPFHPRPRGRYKCRRRFRITHWWGIINFFESALGWYEVAAPPVGSLELEVSAASVKVEHSQLSVCYRIELKYVALTSALYLAYMKNQSYEIFSTLLSLSLY
jgi:hypothetical protein